MNHTFDVGHAEKYGLEEAILITHLQFWILKNRANGKHFHDGRTWTYNSIAAFKVLFPYWKGEKVRRIMESLREQKVLTIGNYNKVAYDRTMWYTFIDESMFLPDQIDLAKTTNRKGKTAEPIPDINTDINTDIIKETPSELSDSSDCTKTSLSFVSKKGKRETKQKEPTDPLYTAIWNSFLSVQPGKSFANYAAAGKATKDICQMIRNFVKPEEEEMEFGRAILETFRRMIQGGQTYYWKTKQFTPTSLAHIPTFEAVIGAIFGNENNEAMLDEICAQIEKDKRDGKGNEAIYATLQGET